MDIVVVIVDVVPVIVVSAVLMTKSAGSSQRGTRHEMREMFPKPRTVVHNLIIYYTREMGTFSKPSRAPDTTKYGIGKEEFRICYTLICREKQNKK